MRRRVVVVDFPNGVSWTPPPQPVAVRSRLSGVAKRSRMTVFREPKKEVDEKTAQS